jgi:hypothetical protein
MQQRQLRLGDIVDDYCPRERRVTNHAVVAMVGDEVKQTRCTTCDAEHEYKAAKVPPQRKKKDTPAALYKQVLSDVAKPDAPAPVLPARAQPAERRTVALPDAVPPPPQLVSPEPAEDVNAPVVDPQSPDGAGEGPEPEEDGPVHRPLIRATLPRPEGQPATRPAPDFTFRQIGSRAGRFRPVNGGGPPRVNRPHGSGGHGSSRTGGPRPPTNGPRGDARGRHAAPAGRPVPRGPNSGARGPGRGKKRSK